MNIGVCHSIYIEHGWLPPHPSPQAWAALKEVGVTHVRLSIPTHIVATPAKFVPPASWMTTEDVIAAPDSYQGAFISTSSSSLLGNYVNTITLGGLKIHANPGGAPRFASEGLPAFEDPIVSTMFWNDGKNGPDNKPPYIHDFGDPKFAAIDKTQPPRPWLSAKGMPSINREFTKYVGQVLTGTIGGNGSIPLSFTSLGWGNEPGDYSGWPPSRWDDVSGWALGGLGDTIRRYFSECVYPFTKGANTYRRPLLVGPEADSADVLDRCLAIENDLYYITDTKCYDIISVHPYGDIAGGPSYATMDKFLAVAKKYRKQFIRIGEIGGDPQALYDFSLMVYAKYPDLEGLFYLEPRTFFEPGSWESNKPVLSLIGNKFKTLFASRKVN